MTAEAPDRSGTNRRWVEDVLEELLDEEGGESTDEQAFENAKGAARDMGAAGERARGAPVERPGH